MNQLSRSHRSDRNSAAFSLLLAAQLLAGLLLLLCPAWAMAQENRQSGKAAQEFVLEAGKSVEREIVGGEAHSYSVTLQPGQLLRAVVSPRDVDAVVALSGPGDEKLLTVDLFRRPRPEPVSFVAEKAGAYRLEVRVDAPATVRGRYELTSEVKTAASEADRERLSAERLLAEALPLVRAVSKESWQRGIEKYDESLVLWRKLGDRYWEAYALNNNGFAYHYLSENQKALNYFNQALALRRQIEDKDGEGDTLINIGTVYADLSENQKALEFYNQALLLKRTIGDKSGEADVLNSMGIAYDELGEKQKALEVYNQSLLLKRAVGDKRSEGNTLNNLGNIYNDLGENQKALEVYNQAMLIRRAIGDKQGEAATLNNLGTVYNDLGEKQKALELYNQALPLERVVGDKRGETGTLTNIGIIYNDLGEKQKALDFYNQALPLRRAIGDKYGEANTLTNIGVAYNELGENQKALEFHEQALSLERAIGDKRGESNTLNYIGNAYNDLGQNQKALEFFNQSLPIERAVGNKNGEADTLVNLMLLWNKMGKPALAIFYGKQAVNVYQQLRGNIQGLDKEIQKTYLKTVEGKYRELVDLLIAADRLPEAQQVLALLKEEEYFEFVRRDPTVSPVTARASLTPDEAELEEEYRKLADQVTLLGKQRGELFGKEERTDEEERLLTRLEEQLSVASDHFQKFLERLQVKLGQNTAKGARVIEVKDALGMKKTLRELGPGAVLLYTLVGADKYRVMLVTPDSEQAYENPTSAIALQRKVLAFREALQDPNANPTPLAQELYRILVGPKLAHDLKQAGATTLMWSLDGVLRYLPIAALHDGQKYLVESYRNVIFTPASRDRLKDPVSAHWKALGLGVSQSRRVELDGLKVAFNPLPGVPKELRSIIRDSSPAAGANSGDGVLAGRVILDESFTKEAMKTALRQRYQLVHIASHFVFQPGNETKSFLLLGDIDPRNDRLTLEEVKKVSFEGVDLLTLSACETALGGKQANGVEVESFGVLAQRQGATAVMATLWPVADESTSLLMREFYLIREATPGITKAEALQRAQLALLRGTMESRIGSAKEMNKSWRHPYYWAPFILIGNWR